MHDAVTTNQDDPIADIVDGLVILVVLVVIALDVLRVFHVMVEYVYHLVFKKNKFLLYSFMNTPRRSKPVRCVKKRIRRSHSKPRHKHYSRKSQRRFSGAGSGYCNYCTYRENQYGTTTYGCELIHC
jgi:hypothetical protein